MTREEALNILHNASVYHPNYLDALNMAIEALEQEPQTFKWCTDCKEYDQEKHCCHRWSKVIRDTVEEMKQEQEPKSEWQQDHAILKAYSDGANNVLDKIRAEIDKARFIDKDTRIVKNALASGLEVAMQIIDKYKGESEK